MPNESGTNKHNGNGCNPASAKEFSRTWQQGVSADQLISGDTAHGAFPDAERRQDRFVGMILNAMMTLVLYEELKEGANPEYLEKMFNYEKIGNMPDFLRDLKESVARTKSLDADTRNQALMTLVLELSDKGCIKTHRQLITDDVWNNYIQQRVAYNGVMADYASQVQEWQAEGMPGEPPRRPRLEKPVSPRISVVNDITQKWISLESPGQKTESSLYSKLRRKGYSHGKDFKGASEVMDMTRVMVQPYTPEVAEEFCQVLRHVFPPKAQENGTEYPRVFTEPWQVSYYGYFDRKAYMAMDRLTETGTPEVAEGLHGMVGEVKIVAKEMSKAEKITAPVYAVLRELDDINKFIPDSGGQKKANKHTEEFGRFRELYERSKRMFGQRCRQEGLSYEFPPFKENQPTKRETYTSVKEALTKLQKRINSDAINQARDEWQEQYLHTAYYQLAAQQRGELEMKTPPDSVDLRRVGPKFNHASFRRDAQRQLEADFPRNGCARG